jgi:hypothetical protein
MADDKPETENKAEQEQEEEEQGGLDEEEEILTLKSGGQNPQSFEISKMCRIVQVRHHHLRG